MVAMLTFVVIYSCFETQHVTERQINNFETSTISPEVIGVKDGLITQIRIASYKVGKGELTIDEAVSKYGTLE